MNGNRFGTVDAVCGHHHFYLFRICCFAKQQVPFNMHYYSLFFRTFGNALTILKLDKHTALENERNISIFHQISICYGYLIFDLRVLFMHLKIYANDFL